MQNRNSGSKNYRYRIRFVWRNSIDTTTETDSLNLALQVASIQMKAHVPETHRVGSLRGDGKVHLWHNGDRAGFVSVEEYKHGEYVLIGG
ncbi:MAG: hypothetical protein C0610_17115 [Desulfobacteraceae bacterium]|nr:MAG: hypothetical protein C0610_17115 [Desulfobacteraceae bacterium]